MEFSSHGKTKSRRKRDEIDEFNSSDDEVLCDELDSSERKLKKFKQSVEYFLCDVCGKQFKHTQSLKNHLQSHLSTFNCHCGKKIRYKRNLHTHQKRCMKKESSFICHQCNAHFEALQDLKSHVDSVHSQKGGRVPMAVEDVSSPNYF